MALKIYLDCDGVLGDWVSQANYWLGQAKDTPWAEYEGSGIDWDKLNDAMSFVAFWKDMEVLPGAKKLFGNLKKLGDVKICTRPFPSPNCLYGRAQWLQEHFNVKIPDTLYMHDKWELAKPGTLLIDDNLENCDLFALHGGRSILFPTTYNTKIVPENKIENVLNQALAIKRKLENA